jgi:predicted RecA/RadA family phage recombinase
MARNFKQPGEIITLPAPTGGTVSGSVYRIGQFVLVALQTKAQTEPCDFARTGVFSVTKVGSQAWTPGSLVYWDNGNTRFTTTSAAGLTLCGFTASTVGSGAGETTGDVLLDGSGRANV